MKQLRLSSTLLIFLLFAWWSQAQSAGSQQAGVPPLVNFSGRLTDVNGKPLTGVVGVTFLLYKDEQGGAPVWLETQNVTPDKNGRYKVTVGATTNGGLPADVFANGEARWLAVQVVGQAEQPRVLLVAVPYALKAADAETIGGLPPSAFVLASPLVTGSAVSSASQSSAAVSTSSPLSTSFNVTTTGGTVKALPLWTTATNIQSSVVTQTGSGSSAKIGINTASPAATLDVKGGTNIEGLLDLPATGTASSGGGKNSQAQNFVASSFNSSTKSAVNQTFQWRAEPTGNNTSSPSGTLNLLFGSGTSSPSETGLKISNKGLFTFASGQTFPGTGTITGVTAGSGLTGGGTSGDVTLGLGSASCTSGQAITALPLTCESFATLGSNKFNGDQSVNGVVTAGSLTSSGILNFTGSTLFGTTASFEGSANTLLFVEQLGTGNGLVIGSGGTGIQVSSNSRNGTGTFSLAFNESQTALGLMGCCPVGSWGDSGASGNAATGLIATADDAKALFVENNSPTGFPTAFLFNNQSSAHNLGVFVAQGRFGFCGTDTDGNLTCTGTKSAVVPVDNGQRQVALYAVEAPQNWFEDFGRGQLTSGAAMITLDSTFTQTVNTASDYHVFLTPTGDCRGLYVSHREAGGFEVRELGGGKSNVAFDYRIVALRRGYETVRLADMTLAAEKLKTNIPKPVATPGSQPFRQAKPPQPPKLAVKRSNLGQQQ